MKLTELFTGMRLLVIISVLTFLLPSLSYAQTGGPYPHITPQKPKPVPFSPKITVKSRKSSASKEIAIPSLKGIVFIPSVKDFNPHGVSGSILWKNGLYIRSLPFLRNPAFLKDMESKLNKPLTFGGINEIISAVRLLYKSHSRPFVDVVAPPQNISSGILQVVVMEYRVGAVKVSGNRWFSSSFIIFQSGLRTGQTLSETDLVSGINWLNENPFLHSDAILSPGRTIGGMDINLLVKDLVPFRVYAGYDNQGIPALGMNEWNAGFNWGNVFGSGQMLSYQIAQSFNAKYRADSLSYDIPFPWHGRLEFLGSYATAVPYINKYFSELGRNAQASVYYKQELPLVSVNGIILKQTAGLGYDLKTTNNNLAFGGVQVFSGTAQIDQLPVFYKISEADPYGLTVFNNRLVISPGDMNADNSTASFNTIYPGTRSDYLYDNALLSRTEFLPLKTDIVSSLNCQIANHNLLYSEQLAAGGLYSLPGYAPDAVTGSKGIILNEEFKLPPVGFSAFNIPSILRLGLFWDYADLSSVENVSAVTGLPNTAVLASTGVIMHMEVANYLDLRFALGWRLRHMPQGSYGKGLSADILLSVGI